VVGLRPAPPHRAAGSVFRGALLESIKRRRHLGGGFESDWQILRKGSIIHLANFFNIEVNTSVAHLENMNMEIMN
jgi:hypothetical protein